MSILDNIKICIPLTGLAPVKSFFGDHDPVPIEKTPSAPELAEANKAMDDMNQQIREQDGRNVKTLKDMLER
jgi:hypothetical protein